MGWPHRCKKCNCRREWPNCKFCTERRYARISKMCFWAADACWGRKWTIMVLDWRHLVANVWREPPNTRIYLRHSNEMRQNYVCFHVTQIGAGAVRRTSPFVAPPPLQYTVMRYAGDARTCRDFQVTCLHFFARCYKKIGNWNSFAVFREILQVKTHKRPLRLASIGEFVGLRACTHVWKDNEI